MNRPVLQLLSGWAFPPESLAPLADALTGSFDVHLGIPAAPAMPARRPAFLAGWSLGGLHALQAACNHPSAWNGVILIASTCRFCVGEPREPAGVDPTVVRAMARRLLREPIDLLREFHQLASANGDADARAKAALALGPDPLATGLADLRRMDLSRRLGDCAVPVLLVHGTADRVIPFEAARWTAERLPHATLRRFADAGHDLPIARAREVADAIARFVGDLA